MHFCVNLVCERDGRSAAVLIRAGAIVLGADLARRRRYGLPDAANNRRVRELDLARGPGRLCQALGIDRSLNGADVCGPGGPLGISPAGATGQPAAAAASTILTGPRVGISQASDRPWRYWLADDRHVSGYRSAQPRSGRPKPVSGRDAGDGTMHG
jgi:DNA-3-methyladenine glycosylase